MRISVYFANNRVGGLGVHLTSSGPLGLQLLAVAAPRRVEFDENVFAAVNDRIEIRGGEHDDFSSGESEETGEGNKADRLEHLIL